MNAPSPRPILHGANSSPYVRKVRVALAYKGIVNLAIAGEKVDAQRHPEMAAYIERILALPCYAPIIEEELPR